MQQQKNVLGTGQSAVASTVESVPEERNAAPQAIDSVKALRADFDSLEDMLAKYMSRPMAHAATQEAKSLIHEIEGWTRRNPLRALAAAVMAGAIIGIGMSGRHSSAD